MDAVTLDRLWYAPIWSKELFNLGLVDPNWQLNVKGAARIRLFVCSWRFYLDPATMRLNNTACDWQAKTWPATFELRLP